VVAQLRSGCAIAGRDMTIDLQREADNFSQRRRIVFRRQGPMARLRCRTDLQRFLFIVRA
jgi:hypothetical protein